MGHSVERVGAWWRAKNKTQRTVLGLLAVVVASVVVWSGVLIDQESYDYQRYTDQACQNAPGYDPPREAEQNAAQPGNKGSNTPVAQPLGPEMRSYCISLGANQLAHASMEASRLSLVFAMLAWALGAVALLIALLEWVSRHDDAGKGRGSSDEASD